MILSWLDFLDFLPQDSSAKSAATWPEKLSPRDAAFLQRHPAIVKTPLRKCESVQEAGNFLRACLESRAPAKRLIQALELSDFGCEISGAEFYSWLAAQGETPSPAVEAWFRACTAPAQAIPAPVVAVETASEAIPDPERRLALLRELGGDAKYSRCEWKFTGIKALVDIEKANGRKRSTEKTIRADLKEAVLPPTEN